MSSRWATPGVGPDRALPREAQSADTPQGLSSPAPGRAAAAAGVAVARGDARWPEPPLQSGDAADSPLHPLEPVGVAGVLDGAFDLLRHGFAPLVGVAAALLVPLQLIDVLSRIDAGITDDLGAASNPFSAMTVLQPAATSVSWIVLVLRVVVLSFLGLLAGTLVADVLGGIRRSGSELVRRAAKRWWVAVIIPVLCVPVKSASSCLFYVGFFLLDALLMCASSVAGAERVGPLAAFARSWRLGWRSYGTALGTAVGGFAIAAILQLALYLGPAALAGIFVPNEALLVVVQQVSLLVLIVTQPLTACISARAYVEFRCRSEGLDLQLRWTRLGLGS